MAILSVISTIIPSRKYCLAPQRSDSHGMAKGKLPNHWTAPGDSDLRKRKQASVKASVSPENGAQAPMRGAHRQLAPTKPAKLVFQTRTTVRLDAGGGGFSKVPRPDCLIEEAFGDSIHCNIDCNGWTRTAARIRTTKQMDLDKLTKMSDVGPMI